MPAITTLHEAMIEEIKDLYDAERQLVKAIPKMAKAATDPALREALESHLDETNGHVKRLEEVFGLLDEQPRAKHCTGIAGIIEEGGEALKGEVESRVLDALIIASGQRAEHYEIAAYGTVIAWAESMGHDDVVDLLMQTIEEEKHADEILSNLAEGRINAAADSGMDEETAEGAAAKGKPAAR